MEERRFSLLPEENKIIREHPKHCKCPECGHEEDIFGACVVPGGEHGYTIYFGSDANFCTRCDAPWGEKK